jgi:sulfur carrier protein ThiS
LIFDGDIRMKVKVRLLGTLGQRFHGYRHDEGIEMEIPDGARVRDLLAHLEISESQGSIVSVDSSLKKPGDKLEDGVMVSVFQPVFGG